MHGKGKGKGCKGAKKLGKSGANTGLAADLRAVVQSASVADFVEAHKAAVAHNGGLFSRCALTSCMCHALMLLLAAGPGVPKGATVGKVCIALISGNLALQKKKKVHCFQFLGLWSVA
jgi:hypothetical protein